MPNKKYNKGAAFERKVKRYYEAMGYLVIRSAGSKGLVDLVCITDSQTFLLQCKASKSEAIRADKVLSKLRLPPYMYAFSVYPDKSKGHGFSSV